MNDKRKKIAIISAFIGNGGASGEISFTPEAKRELEEYGVDVFLFNENNIDQLLTYYKPEKSKKEIIGVESILDRLNYIYLKNRYKQKVYPTEKDNYTRLVAKIARMQFFKIIPQEYDYYIWLDSKFTIQEHWLKYVLWLIDTYQYNDIIVSRHCERSTVKEELYFMVNNRHKIGWNLSQKYNMSKMLYQYNFYKKDASFVDHELYETTMLIYSNSILSKTEFLNDWYAHNYYLSIQDQLSFPFLIQKHKVKVKGIVQRVFDMPFTNHEYSSK